MDNNIVELGTFEAIKNGKPLRYRIQTITPELIDTVADFMAQYLLSREPITSYEKFLEDPIALADIKHIWIKLMKTGTCIVALEELPANKINVIGANMTLVSKKGEDQKTEDFQSDKCKRLVIAMQELVKRGNIFEKYNIDKYLSAYGLTVHPNYHGYQIGARLLECRRKLCEILGLTVSGTVFTAQVSQHIAKKVGFKVLSQQDYKTCKIDNVLIYPNLDGDMKFMAIEYK